MAPAYVGALLHACVTLCFRDRKCPSPAALYVLLERLRQFKTPGDRDEQKKKKCGPPNGGERPSGFPLAV